MVSDTLTTVLISAYLGTAGDYAPLYQGQIEPSFVQTTWTTHPYWDDNDYQLGDICFCGTLYPAVPLRYNILENKLAVITPDGKLPIIPDQNQIEWFEIAGIRYVREKGRFMCEEYHGKEYSLLRSRIKYYAGEVVSDRHSYKDIMTEEQFFLRSSEGTLHRIHNLKSLIKAAPSFRDDLSRYKHEKHLKFTKSERKGSLKLCAELLDRLNGKRGTNYPLEQVSLSSSITPELDSLFSQVSATRPVPAYRLYTGKKLDTFVYTTEEVQKTPGIAPIGTFSEARSLQEVEVLGMHSKLSQQLSGVESFRPALLRNIPLVMGEADVLKLALKLPGVSSTGEASSGINVRGGATEHTQMLYNGNTIFNPMHLFGLFSAFDPDLVSETKLYKGSIPSQYGGRLSSVMNMKGRIPDYKEFHGSASVGLVTSRAMIEVPIVKGKVSLLLGGRATYSDWMLKLIPKESESENPYEGLGTSYNKVSSYRDGNANYWDVGGTLSSILNPDHILLINGYYSHDNFSLTQYKKYAYTNMNFSVELRSHLNENLSSTFTAGYDHYDYCNDDSEFHSSAARLSFDLNQYFVKGVADYRINDKHSLNMGVQGQYYHILPGSYRPLGSGSYIIGRTLASDDAVEGGLWMEDEWKYTPSLTLTGGLRLNVFSSFKKGLEHTYIAPDIRVSANYKLDENSSIKAGFNTLHQFIHKVSNTVIMSPADSWMLSNSRIRPQRGWQLSAGYYWQPGSRMYELSAEAYYKRFDDYLAYRSGAILVMNEQLEKDVVRTKGRAYGLELQIRKLYGRLNGWLSYTYSRTELKQKQTLNQSPINHGQWFPADYDSPHDIKLVCNFKFTRRYSTSLNADYSTGRPFTAPIAIMPSEATGNYSVPVYSERNACRMPDYFRVDWSFNIEPSHHLTNLTHSWFTIGVYNVFGRRNAYSIYYEGSNNRINGYKISIFGAPIPYVNYNIKF